MTILREIEQKLRGEIKQAILKAHLAKEHELPEIILEKPKDPQHGDFASNIAMQLARIARKAPRQIAEEIIEHFSKDEQITKIEIAGPGFINFFMASDFLKDLIPQILSQGETYGTSNEGKNKKVQVEFVSVNPTGLIHLGHARGAAFGDALCNVLEATGYTVEREYYINDAGNQINQLGLSIEARYLEKLGHDAEMPEDGYFGKDIVTIAGELIEKEGDKWVFADRDERLNYFKEYGLKSMLAHIKKDLQNFRVEFDTWFSERSLYKDEQITKVIEQLKEKDYVYEEDGAVWFRSTAFGDDKDRVLIKKDGTYTYLAPDIAYHENKYERGYDKVINVWGADHHGYVPRMEAAIQALGHSIDSFTVKIIQMVSLLEKGETLRMSKRSGNAVTLRDFMKELDVDAIRYYFVTRSNDSHLDFDVELAKEESNDNPVYYVQYAHARICTLLKQAENQGFVPDDAYDTSLLVNEKEVELLTKLASFPQVLIDASKNHAPHFVTQYVFDLAAQLHSYYNAEKVIDLENEPRTKARIALMKAVQITLQNGLRIIGVSAPEKM